MHARLYNEAIFSLRLRPDSPLLIKAGSSGEEALDPTLPEMSFVRTMRPGETEEEVYIPGSSLRGVLRSHAEKLLRSVDVEMRSGSVHKRLACDPTQTSKGGRLGKACFAGESNTEKISGPDAYNGSCYACKVFGNTTMASRVRVGDLYLNSKEGQPLLERRYGVAIDRVTGGVAQGPFEIEILTDAIFEGQLTVRNFTLGQFALLAGTLLDLSEGLVPMGYGKSRGLGRVNMTFEKVMIRTLRNPNGAIVGVGAVAGRQDHKAYQLPEANTERLPVEMSTTRQRGFYTLQSSGEEARRLLNQISSHWVEEVGR